ncbi:MAG TPA: hypothetical protein VFT45_10400 [Longimicrobium sp.]|nr:hypothetical protein [Longimicrobium sp.]
MRIVNRAARWTLAAVVTGSLSFGVSQAVASPGGAAKDRICTTTNCPQIICKCASGQCVDRETGAWCFA